MTTHGIPNLSEAGMSQAVGAFVALHEFTDGDVWLLRLHPHTDDWVTVRRASDRDWDTFTNSGLLTTKGKELLAARLAQRGGGK